VVKKERETAPRKKKMRGRKAKGIPGLCRPQRPFKTINIKSGSRETVSPFGKKSRGGEGGKLRELICVT